MYQFLYLSCLSLDESQQSRLQIFRDCPSPPDPQAVLSALGRTPKGYREHAERAARYLETHPEVRCLSWWDSTYPDALRNIPAPPWALFYKGQLPHFLNGPLLGVVGTRRPNLYGREVLAHILNPMRGYRFQVISGLAHGIDALAHTASLDLGAPNFAVLGNSIDWIYPRAHERLAARILETGGGIISEYPPLFPTRANAFPWRNRIVSGLADVTWVVQGTNQSGSRHTANHAAKQGRTVLVTPGDLFSELSETPHALLREGATPIFSAEDLRQALDFTCTLPPRPSSPLEESFDKHMPNTK